MPVEELPDPFVPEEGPEPELEPVQDREEEPRRRRRWPIVLYSIAGLIFVTLVWLVLTAPLSRALEPLDDPALLMLSDDGYPIARRGAIKEAPVDVTMLNR